MKVRRTKTLFHLLLVAELFRTVSGRLGLRRYFQRTKRVSHVGDNGIPKSNFPLQKCQSDCDEDTDCSIGLVCYHRINNYINVPGCRGITDEYDGDDFCVDPADVPSNMLLRVGNDDEFVSTSYYPLAKCRGDCDDDDDCLEGLKCLNRNGGYPTTVPGCYGETAYLSTDYCYDPNDVPPTTPLVPPPPTSSPVISPTSSPVDVVPTTMPMDNISSTNNNAKSLELIADNGIPKAAFPLQKCQGDCDKDSDCVDGLVCFNRENEKGIPGCIGDTDDKGTDYCYDPIDLDPSSLAKIGNNGLPKKYFPLAKCRGDCDKDEDCAGPLKCFQRNKDTTDIIPGCNGRLEASTDYCYDPADENNSNIIVPTISPQQQPVPTSTPVTPPTPTQPPIPTQTVSPVIPAPTDTGSPPSIPAPTTDSPVMPAPPPVPAGVLTYMGDDGEPINKFPLDRCQGDCDNDSECRGPLRCYQRDYESTVPGCIGVAEVYVDYCYDPADDTSIDGGQLPYPGDDWDPLHVFPLGLCEGDCDGDSDCIGELVCHQRDEIGQVPSCVGRPYSNADYCVHPSDETATPPVPESFRIKMFWAEGFNWQEEFWEQEWCMICDTFGGLNCNVDNQIFIDTCDDDVTWFVFENLDNELTQIRVATTTLCLELTGNRDIRLRECDSTNTKQKFGSGDGSYIGDKFELIPVTKPDGCLSQQHHPAELEQVFTNGCDTARKWHTSFWFKY